MKKFDKLVQGLLADESKPKAVFFVLHVSQSSAVCCIKHKESKTEVLLEGSYHPNRNTFNTFQREFVDLFKLLTDHKVVVITFDSNLMMRLTSVLLCSHRNSFFGLYTCVQTYYNKPHFVIRIRSPVFIDILDVLGETRNYTFNTSKGIEYTLDQVAIFLHANLPFPSQSKLNYCLNLKYLKYRELILYSKWSISVLDHCHRDYVSWIKIRILFSQLFEQDVFSLAYLTRRNLAEKVITLNSPKVKKRKKKQEDISIPDEAQDNLGIAENYPLLYSYKHNALREKIVNKQLEPLCIGNVSLKYGRGGLHSIHEGPSSYVSDNEYVLVECDITSYYPTLILKLLKAGIDCPIPNFSELFEMFVRERIHKKKQKQKEAADVYKIILNSIYGSTNYKYSQIYAPIITFSVTINGQLLLLDILESLMETIDDLSILWVNTDGFVLKIKRSNKNKLDESLSKCEEKYGVEFGMNEEFHAFYIKNVNSYIMINSDNVVKIKGLSQVVDPLCFNKVAISILSESNKTGWTYENIYREFVNKCEFKDYIYIDKERYNSTTRYFCSQRPTYFGGNLPIKGKKQITHNFTLCETDLSLHNKEEVCIDHYVGIFLKELEKYNLYLTDTIEQGNHIYSKLVTQRPTLPLLAKAYELAKENIFVASGNGTHINKEHLVSENLCEPLDHLKDTLINPYVKWVDAATLHVQDVNLLIIQVQSFDKLKEYIPHLSTLLEETWFISFSNKEFLVLFFQIEESVSSRTSKHLPFVTFFKKLNAQSKAGCKLISSFPVFGNMESLKEGTLTLNGEKLKKFATNHDMFAFFSRKTEVLNTTLSDYVTENSGTSIVNLPQVITKDTQDSSLVTTLNNVFPLQNTEKEESQSYASKNEKLIDLAEEDGQADSVLLDHNQKLEVSSRREAYESTPNLDLRFPSISDKLATRDSKLLDILDKLANMDTHSLAILDKLTNMDSKSLAILDKLIKDHSILSSVERPSVNMNVLSSVERFSVNMNKPTEEETIGLTKSDSNQMSKFYAAADLIIKKDTGVTLERNLIALFMLWVTGESVTYLLENWTLKDFLILLETGTVTLPTSNKTFTIREYQRKAANDLKTICSNYLSIPDASPLLAIYEDKPNLNREEVGRKISRNYLCRQLNKRLKGVGVHTRFFNTHSKLLINERKGQFNR